MNTQIIKVKGLDDCEAELLAKAADVIKNGGLVVFPTETVYGLGADATNPRAAEKIYEAKGRPSDNPLIIHVAKPADAEKYAYTNDIYYALAEKFMPGPLTVILKAKSTVPERTRASLPTVAVRCPEHPVARKLIELSGVAIAAPSANLSGTPSPTKSSHVIDDMMGRVDMIIDGTDAEFGLESTIVSICDDNALMLLRPGKITVDDLKTVCQSVNIAPSVKKTLEEGEKPLSPGMKYKHYAPKAPMYLLEGNSVTCAEYVKREINGDSAVAIIAYEDDVAIYRAALPDVFIYSFGKREDESSAAHLLFNILRDADKHSFSKIYAPLPSDSGIGLALYNRMIRAAAHQIIRM